MENFCVFFMFVSIWFVDVFQQEWSRQVFDEVAQTKHIRNIEIIFSQGIAQ